MLGNRSMRALTAPASVNAHIETTVPEAVPSSEDAARLRLVRSLVCAVRGWKGRSFCQLSWQPFKIRIRRLEAKCSLKNRGQRIRCRAGDNPQFLRGVKPFSAIWAYFLPYPSPHRSMFFPDLSPGLIRDFGIQRTIKTSL